MTKVIVFATICVLFISCGSQNDNSQKAQEINISRYKMSLGGDTVLSVFNRLATGKGCYEQTLKEMLWVTTMPSYCYLTGYKLFPNLPDTPITVGLQYVDTNVAFNCYWSWLGWPTWGTCQPTKIYWPIDTINNHATDGEITTWIVSQKAYQNIIAKINVKYARNIDTLFKAGLAVIPAKNIVGISNWGVEDSLGFCGKKLPTDYANLFCSAGVTLKVALKGNNNKDSTIDCYLVIDNDQATMRWKDTISVTKQ